MSNKRPITDSTSLNLPSGKFFVQVFGVEPRTDELAFNFDPVFAEVSVLSLELLDQ